jgi:MFS family permease/quinol monooxygenase YgiN
VSNLGTWMQNVGAAWMMTTLSASPLLIALVQTATTLPVFLLGVPAGALADLVDRRKLLLWTQTWMLAAALVLGIMTIMGYTGPWLLLGLTFALGLGSTMNGPAWQATVPQLVPREQLAAAVALNSVQFNIARAIGPAIGGLVVAIWNPGVAFIFNAASFLSVILVLFFWKNTQQENGEHTEGVIAAIWAGGRFVRHSPVLRSVLVRTAVFVICASAVWALLPVVAKQEIGSGSGGYGILLGCLGAGAVLAAISFAHLRAIVSPDRVLVAGTLVYAAATLALGYFDRFALLCIAMVAGGVAWMLVMSTFNVTAQLALPGWVRARALSFYIFTFQAGLALGSWMWGEVALRTGTRFALLISAFGLVVGIAAVFRYRLIEAAAEDLTPSMHWPEPAVQTPLDPAKGPVLVEIEYRVDPERSAEFLRVIHQLGVTRKRDGAVRWGVFEDTEQPGRYEETFVVESWAEHMRQHERGTMVDRELQKLANSFHLGPEPPRVRHLIWAGASKSGRLRHRR